MAGRAAKALPAVSLFIIEEGFMTRLELLMKKYGITLPDETPEIAAGSTSVSVSTEEEEKDELQQLPDR